MRAAETDELPQVMREVMELMGGCGAALTLHPLEDRRASPVSLSGEDCPPPPVIDMLLRTGALSPDVDPDEGSRWFDFGSGSSAWQAVVLPVKVVEGHSPLSVTIFYRDITDARKAEVEAAYCRRPLAGGYFRLWQADQVRRRKVDALRATLDLTALGIMLLDQSAGLLFANRAARVLLTEADGLRERDGRLRAVSLADGARFQAAIAHAVDARNDDIDVRAPMLAIRRKAAPDLIVSVLPAPAPPLELGDVAATIFVVDPTAESEQSLEPICKLFKLSHVETRLACRLACGATLCDAATALRLREQTARSYLKQIFLKTGTNRQTDLVRVMLSRAIRVISDVHFDVL